MPLNCTLQHSQVGKFHVFFATILKMEERSVAYYIYFLDTVLQWYVTFGVNWTKSTRNSMYFSCNLLWIYNYFKTKKSPIRGVDKTLFHPDISMAPLTGTSPLSCWASGLFPARTAPSLPITPACLNLLRILRACLVLWHLPLII